MIRRTVIQQLSCHFALEFQAIEQQYDIEFTKYFAKELEELKAMEEDSLLALSSDDIQVTPAGRMLIRNICMVFDEHLRQQTSEQGFSKVI